MLKLKKKQYTIKLQQKDKNSDITNLKNQQVLITYVTGKFEKTVCFTHLEQEIQFVDLLKEAGYTYVDISNNTN